MPKVICETCNKYDYMNTHYQLGFNDLRLGWVRLFHQRAHYFCSIQCAKSKLYNNEYIPSDGIIYICKHCLSHEGEHDIETYCLFAPGSRFEWDGH